jgi:NADH-quinone oxidoreductase subunit M
MFATSTWLGFVMTTGIVLGAAYMLWLYGRVAFGEVVHADAGAMPDLKPREWAVMLPLAISVLAIGIYPKPLMEPLKAPVASLVARLERSEAPSVVVTRRATSDRAPA